jgi:biopolymer transport protein TolR
MALSGHSRASHEAGGFREINVTPLVDVMLVLLVVFMVTAPHLSAGLHVDLPEAQAAETQLEAPPLVLSIASDAKMTLGETDVTENLEEFLRDNPRVQAEHELYIRADKRVPYEAVAHAMAIARNAGVTSLNFVVDPSANGAP